MRFEPVLRLAVVSVLSALSTGCIYLQCEIYDSETHDDTVRSSATTFAAEAKSAGARYGLELSGETVDEVRVDTTHGRDADWDVEWKSLYLDHDWEDEDGCTACAVLPFGIVIDFAAPIGVFVWNCGKAAFGTWDSGSSSEETRRHRLEPAEFASRSLVLRDPATGALFDAVALASAAEDPSATFDGVRLARLGFRSSELELCEGNTRVTSVRLPADLVAALASAAAADEARLVGAIHVGVGDDLVAKVNGAPAGAMLLLAEGEHRASAPLQPKPGVELRGRGPTRTRVRSSAVGSSIDLGLAAGDGNGAAVIVRELALLRDPVVAGDGIVVEGEACIEDCRITGCARESMPDEKTRFGNGIAALEGATLRLSRCLIEECANSGVTVLGDGVARIESLVARRNEQGLVYDGGVLGELDLSDSTLATSCSSGLWRVGIGPLRLQDVVLRDNGRNGARVAEGPVLFSGCTFERNQESAVYVAEAQEVALVGCRLAGHRDGVWAAELAEVALTDCTIVDCSNEAVEASMLSDVSVGGCTLERNGTAFFALGDSGIDVVGTTVTECREAIAAEKTGGHVIVAESVLRRTPVALLVLGDAATLPESWHDNRLEEITALVARMKE